MEYLLIDQKTTPPTFQKELRWNDLYFHLAKGL
jgi:L-arabinose isomerase